MHMKRTVIIAIAGCIAILTLSTNAVQSQQSQHKMLSGNLYQNLDDLARDAHDPASVQSLNQAIVGSYAMFGPVPESSLLPRMDRTELGYMGGRESKVTEASVANAINYLGRQLAGSSYTGTNELQVHLLRVDMYRNLPHLLQSPTPHSAKKLVGPDMTPAGGAFIALFLLSQKLTNSDWFGDPDTQNKKWLAWVPDPNARIVSYISPSTPDPPVAVAVRHKLERGLQSENSSTTRGFHRFLDIVGFDQ